MAIAFIVAAVAAAQAGAPQGSIEGLWRSPGGNSIIAIRPCGSVLCGTVAWASDKAKRDARKATDQLVGTPLLTDLTQKSAGRWQARLFVPDKNMRVIAKIELVGPQQLKVSGCALGKSLCKTQLWTRTAGPLPGSD